MAKSKVQAKREPNNHFETIHNWGEIREVYDKAIEMAVDGDQIIEVGVWLGHSVCYAGEIALRAGKNIRIHAVDIFGAENVQGDMVKQGVKDHNDALHKFEANIEAQGLLDSVSIHSGDSVLGADHFEDNTILCVYIDADHSYEAVIADMVAYFPKVKPGGILGGHDWLNTDTEVRKAVEWFAKRFDYEIHVTDEQWPSWYIIK